MVLNPNSQDHWQISAKKFADLKPRIQCPSPSLSQSYNLEHARPLFSQYLPRPMLFILLAPPESSTFAILRVGFAIPNLARGTDQKSHPPLDSKSLLLPLL